MQRAWRGTGADAGLSLPRTADLSLGKRTGPGFASDFVRVGGSSGPPSGGNESGVTL